MISLRGLGLGAIDDPFVDLHQSDRGLEITFDFTNVEGLATIDVNAYPTSLCEGVYRDVTFVDDDESRPAWIAVVPSNDDRPREYLHAYPPRELVEYCVHRLTGDLLGHDAVEHEMQTDHFADGCRRGSV